MNKSLLIATIAGIVVFSLCCAYIVTKSEEQPTVIFVQADLQPPELQGLRAKSEHKGPEKMDDFLNLSPEQKALAKEIRANSRQKIEPLMKEMNALRQKMDLIRKADMQQFETILTPEQMAKLNKVKQQRQGISRRTGGHRFMPRRHKNFDKPEKPAAE